MTLWIWHQCWIQLWTSKTISNTWHNTTEMPQHKGDCHELCFYCNRTDNAQLEQTKGGIFQIAPLRCLSFPSQSSRLLFKMVSGRAANPNSEITHSAAHGTVSALVQAWRERMEGGIRFSSPEIRHTGGPVIVQPPPAELAQCDGAPPLLRSYWQLKHWGGAFQIRLNVHLVTQLV